MKLEDLQPFCSVDETRAGILSPFNHGGHTYATNGRLIVRVPQIEEIPHRKGQPSDPDKVIPAGIGYKPVEMPPGWEHFQPTMRECDDCEGTGQQVKCLHCAGTGEVECETCGHEDECKPCGGTGRAPKRKEGPSNPCEECDGEGKYALPFGVSLNRGAVVVDLQYLRLVCTLPNVRVTYLNATSPLRFEFDGGDGAMMPRRDCPNDGVPTSEQWSAAALDSQNDQAI